MRREIRFKELEKKKKKRKKKRNRLQPATECSAAWRKDNKINKAAKTQIIRYTAPHWRGGDIALMALSLETAGRRGMEAECTDGRMDAQKDGWTDGRIHERTEGRTDQRTNEWQNGF